MLLLHAPVDTDGQTQLPTSVYLATLLFPFMHMSRSVYVSSLGAEQTGFLVTPSLLFSEGAYSAHTFSALPSVPPMWLIITVSVAMASWGQSHFILKQ